MYLDWKGLLLGHLVKLLALFMALLSYSKAIPDGRVSSLASNISSFTTSVLATGSTVSLFLQLYNLLNFQTGVFLLQLEPINSLTLDQQEYSILVLSRPSPWVYAQPNFSLVSLLWSEGAQTVHLSSVTLQHLLLKMMPKLVTVLRPH